MKKILGIEADKLGIVASVTCAVHCSVLPLLLAMSSFTAMEWMMSEWVEWLFFASAILISFWTILPFYHRTKKNGLALMLMIGAALCLLINLLVHSHNGEVQPWSVVGGLLMVLAHIFNLKARQQSACSVQYL